MSTHTSASTRIAAGRSHRRRRTVSLRLRVRVLMHGARLERLLIEGADPVSSPELALRAFQLTRRPHRGGLAASLAAVLAGAGTRSRRSASAAPLARTSIAAARPVLVDLARALREEPVVTARGVAMTRRLLADGTGPLYVESGDGSLQHTAERALAALVGRR